MGDAFEVRGSRFDVLRATCDVLGSGEPVMRDRLCVMWEEVDNMAPRPDLHQEGGGARREHSPERERGDQRWKDTFYVLRPTGYVLGSVKAVMRDR